MCYHRSFIVTEDLKVYSHPLSDHHTDIRQQAGIREDGFHYTVPHAAIEYNPVQDLFDVERGWKLTIDEQIKPSWWRARHARVALDSLISDFKRKASVDSRVYRSFGSIEIPQLQSLRKGSVIVAGKSVMLRDVGMYLEDVTIIADRIRFEPREIREFHNCRFVCREFETPSIGIYEYLNRTNQLTEFQSKRMSRHNDMYDAMRLASASMQYMGMDLAGPLKP